MASIFSLGFFRKVPALDGKCRERNVILVRYTIKINLSTSIQHKKLLVLASVQIEFLDPKIVNNKDVRHYTGNSLIEVLKRKAIFNFNLSI